ncbi:MAG: M20/M25/M40 family metallo-hydrolase [Acidobacteria bacterium]|nr:M20/M25/M40 family metallo-hydrolase [Acidobacteriota bacterium]
MRLITAVLAGGLSLVTAQVPMKALNPRIAKIVSEVSAERVGATMRKLEGFGTRNIFSSQDDPKRGIGAAARWIRDEMASYSPRLQVRLDEHDIKKGARVVRDVRIANVVAVLPGTAQKDRQVLISGHFDSLHIVRKKVGELERMDQEATIAADAPGASDDGSGTAAVMELARVLSQYEFEKTLVFVAFSGEEYGLLGANQYAKRAASEKTVIDAVLNNDIIGNDLAGNGRTAGTGVRVFSDDPSDSPSRTLARYVKEIGERYVPAMKVNLVFRADRFMRGGDHTPFDRAGFPAVRFTTIAEFYANQHTASDTFANASPKYTASVASVNAAVAASLALAPPAPDILTKIRSVTANTEIVGPNLSRGKSGYDALLKWKEQGDVTDLAGFAVVWRDSVSPYWEKEFWVGPGKEFRLTDVSIDDIVLGVKAVDKEGNESPVSVYRIVPRLIP